MDDLTLASPMANGGFHIRQLASPMTTGGFVASLRVNSHRVREAAEEADGSCHIRQLTARADALAPPRTEYALKV